MESNRINRGTKGREGAGVCGRTHEADQRDTVSKMHRKPPNPKTAKP